MLFARRFGGIRCLGHCATFKILLVTLLPTEIAVGKSRDVWRNGTEMKDEKIKKILENSGRRSLNLKKTHGEVELQQANKNFN